ncbi:TIGR02281 family clan AA aspartic protease [Caenimonas terrae]|uniref:TIGR02281 family clan AA aspartic protease n=1 Tax=Caenimonas terrae TaxID=696074 RepID=A0ABW0NBZ6_9BURK
MRLIRALLLGLAVLALAAGASAQSVSLQGMLGNRALLVVDGGQPHGVAPGDSWQGVKVLSTSGDSALVDIKGKQHTLRIGDSQVSIGGTGSAPRGSKIVLSAGSGGHFLTAGTINGRAVQFMVDTGASLIGMGVSEAERFGVDYKNGQPVRMQTANGLVPGWRVKLASVRVGDVEIYDVDAVVGTQSMGPYVLLGNSFLSRFQMRRDNEQMVLERRF